ncbi:MAG: YtfJ family uncharacterized protein [Litorivivens sp.]|jgi:YtfJ family uncharacterized protein
MHRLITLLIASLLPLSVWAVSIGEALPELQIANKGELILEGEDDVGYQPWNSASLDTKGAVQIVQYMAARPSAEKQIRPFTDKLEEIAYPVELHHVTTVVNLDDVTFGMSSFALSELEKNKRRYSMSTLVGDWDGKGLKEWGLNPKGSALMILDSHGTVLFVKDGKLNKKEIDEALALIGKEVAKRQ